MRGRTHRRPSENRAAEKRSGTGAEEGRHRDDDRERLPAEVYRECVLYTTLSPCYMCAGTAMLYEIPRIVIGENHSFSESEEWLRGHGKEIVVADDESCIALMTRMMAERPELWAEDIGGEA